MTRSLIDKYDVTDLNFYDVEQFQICDHVCSLFDRPFLDFPDFHRIFVFWKITFGLRAFVSNEQVCKELCREFIE